MPEQSLTLEAALSSGSAKRSATHLNGSLTWCDLESGASVGLILASKTAAPFAYTVPSALTGAVRVDQLSAEALRPVVLSWLQRARSVFASFVPGGAVQAVPIATVQPR